MFAVPDKTNSQRIDPLFAEALGFCKKYEINKTLLASTAAKKLQEWLNLLSNYTFPPPIIVAAAVYHAFFVIMTDIYDGMNKDRGESPWCEINELMSNLVQYVLKNVPEYQDYMKDPISKHDAEMEIQFKIQHLARPPIANIGPETWAFIKNS